MAKVLCGCGVYKIDPETATLVLNFVPQCNELCLRRAEKLAADTYPFTSHRHMGEIMEEERRNGIG